MSKQLSKEAQIKWDAYRTAVKSTTDIPIETDKEKRERIKRLHGDFFAFCKFYYPKYYTHELADFHKKFVNKVINADRLYAVAAWAREHGKSVIIDLFIPSFLVFTGKRKNTLLVSNTADNADELLMPIMIQLESNQRIIYDYGKQKGWGRWEVGKFVTTGGCSFRAIGAGQSPRGARNEEARPDLIIVDDIDTDEICRNPKRQHELWKWVEKALIPTVSISGNYTILFAGNIIGKKSIIVRAIEKADFHQIINILDKNGKPSWSRNSMEDVKYILSKISYFAAQQEYFNNPINEGTVFNEMKHDKVPPLSKFDFLVAYCDSSVSNAKKNDYKALILLGIYKGKVYVIKAFVKQTTLDEMIDWFYMIRDYVNGKCQVYYYMECNGFQVPWFDDVFTPALKKRYLKQGILSVSKDDTDKGPKFQRIEGDLEPLHRNGDLVFNKEEENNSGMKTLIEQFEALDPLLSAHDDGPDATQGAYALANNKLRILPKVEVGKTKRSKHKF
jgi:hypothetical protein